MPGSGNEYFVLEEDRWIALPDRGSGTLGFGRDYYAEVLRIIEESGRLTRLTFYLSKEAPRSLPSYGSHVIVVIIGDEHYRYFPYFNEILAILRCYGPRPRYLDGWPTNRLKLSALCLFLLKMGQYLKGLWQTTYLHLGRVRDLQIRTLHVPLGCFEDFRPQIADFSSRNIDYAFLGSIDYRQHPWYSVRALMRPSKFISRTRMMHILSVFASTNPQWRGQLDVSGGFQDSISKPAGYAAAMADCKISICPRGSNPETYRFYEACKSACVVVCEELPKTWFHEGHPGLVINDWRQLLDLLPTLLNDSVELARLSSASREFWMSKLSEKVVAERIAVFVLGLDRYTGGGRRTPP